MIGRIQLVIHLPWKPECRYGDKGIPKAYLPASLRINVLQENKLNMPWMWMNNHVSKTEGPCDGTHREAWCRPSGQSPEPTMLPKTTVHWRVLWPSHTELHMCGTQESERKENVHLFPSLVYQCTHAPRVSMGIQGQSSKCLQSISKHGYLILI